jgi:hypothetical protein
MAVNYTTEASPPDPVDEAAPVSVGFELTLESSSYLDALAQTADTARSFVEPTPSPSPTPAASPTAGPSIATFSRTSAPLPPSSVTVRGAIRDVNITFYDCANQGFCGEMYNGEMVHEGAAACSWNLPIGTAFFIVGDPTGRIYICKDRGLLTDTWVDIFWYHPADGYSWQAAVGRYGTIAIVSLP